MQTIPEAWNYLDVGYGYVYAPEPTGEIWRVCRGVDGIWTVTGTIPQTLSDGSRYARGYSRTLGPVLDWDTVEQYVQNKRSKLDGNR